MGLFNRNPERDEIGHLQAEFESLWEQDAERLGRMEMYREEAESVRDPDLEMYLGGGDTSDYGRVRRTRDDVRFKHRLPLPLGRALTIKHAYRISGRMPDVFVDKRVESREERHRSDIMEKVVWAIHRASNGPTTIASGAWHGSEIGSTCFDVYWDIKKNIPRYRVCDPATVVVVPGVDDPHDFQRIYRAWDVPLQSFLYEYKDTVFRDQAVSFRNLGPHHDSHGVEMVRLVQMTDKHRSVRFVCGSEDQSLPLTEYVHDYGFVNYVVIPNIGPYNEIWGWADYEFVRALVQYIPMLLAREADVIRATANGSYIDRGTGQNSAQVAAVLSEGGVLPSKRDGSLDPINPPDMPQFEEAHAQRAIELFKMLGFAPDASWGNGGAMSGADRGLMLQPLVEYTAMKQSNWSAGLQRLFSYAFQMIEQKMIGNSTYRGTKIGSGNRAQPFSFVFGPDAEPLDVDEASGPYGDIEAMSLPMTPKEIFDGEYDARFVWQNRVDPDDPAYVMSETNKFTTGLQSMETTLERLGFQAPQDEMRRIEKEAERFPWVNQGLVSMLIAQLRGNAQGQGGGNPGDPMADQAGALGMMTGQGGGALAADAATAALGPDATGTPYGAA